MNNNSNPKLLGWLIMLLGVIALAKLLWVAAEWLIPLPVQGVDHTEISLRHTLRYHYRLASDAQLKVLKKPTKPHPTRSTLSQYKLIGIYSNTSLAVVTLVRGAQSFVLTNEPKGGTVEGYALKEANSTVARFAKGKSHLTLTLFEKKLPTNSRNSPIRKTTHVPSAKAHEAPIITEGDITMIDRSLIQDYAENPDKIWKNIGLYEVRSSGKLNGFKVRFVRQKSPFAKLGLKRGDIIRSINGEPIVGYAGPMRMLRSADAIDDLSITIERNHEEQELKYEVK